MKTDDKDTISVATYSQNDATENLLIYPIIHRLAGCVNREVVVDYGCGEGELAFMLANRGAKVLGIDISYEMIKTARNRWRHPELSFRQISGNEIPADDCTIDKVISNLVFMMIPSLTDIRKVISESERVLRQKGRLVFCITNPSFLDKDFATYRNIFSEGFHYDTPGGSYQFVLKQADGSEITDPSFKDHHYRWSDYLNAIADTGLMLAKVTEIQVPENHYSPYVVFCAVKP